MPTTRTLIISLAVGCALFVLFAFTLIGLVGEAVAALSVIGLVLRAICVASARVRKTEPC